MIKNMEITGIAIKEKQTIFCHVYYATHYTT